MLHLSGPFEKSPEISSLVPQKLPELQKADLVHFYAAVGFNSPEQIRTTPGRQTVSASGIPHESKHVAHAASS